MGCTGWRVVVAAVAVVWAGVACGKIIYVDDDANSPGDGRTWATAYKYLQDALADANSSPKPVEIRVAQGVYLPDRSGAEPNGTGDRLASFELVSGVALVGGYAGLGAADPNALDPRLYETILSGDLAGDDVPVQDPCDLPGEPTRDENSHRVVVARDVDEAGGLDGCVVSGGGQGLWYDPGCAVVNVGGRPIYADCVLTGNAGLCAMENVGSSCVVVGCRFAGNGGMGIGNRGGGMPRFVRCEIRDNAGAGVRNEGLPGEESFIIAVFQDSRIVENAGRGMHNTGCRVELTGCEFKGNRSGGLYNDTSDPVLVGCVFADNVARAVSTPPGAGGFNADGGGVSNMWSNPVLQGCVFIGNRAPHMGGAIHNTYSSSATVSHCLFVANSAGGSGGAINHCGGEMVLTNCTFAENSSDVGGVVACSGSIRIENCILFDPGHDEIVIRDNCSLSVAFSLVRGGWPGEGTLDADPLFADVNEYDYHLKSQGGRWDAGTAGWLLDDVTSPCIDAGDPLSPIGSEPFPNGGRVNMGAYGGTAQASKSYFGGPPCETIVAGDINGDCRVDFKDIGIMLIHWLESGSP